MHFYIFFTTDNKLIRFSWTFYVNVTSFFRIDIVLLNFDNAEKAVLEMIYQSSMIFA